MTKETAEKTVTITLTDERPVTITNGRWPVVAKATHDTDHNNQQIFCRHYLRVRQHDTGESLDELKPHTDGQCLVYGWYQDDHQGAHGAQAGYRCHIDDVVGTIRTLGEKIGAEEWLIDECVANLPAVEEPDEEPGPGLPAELSIAIRVETREQAEVIVKSLTALEADVRAGLPSLPATRLADAVAETRRGLQERAGLVVAP